MKPSRIPLFPLDVVLLPTMRLPLHIFEPRYKLMIARCLNEKLEFGVVLAVAQATATIGCTARILEKIKAYADGRMDILTEGHSVLQLKEIIEENMYYEAVVEYLTEDRPPAGAENEAGLVELFQQCHILLFGRPWAGSDPYDSTQLSYQIAARLPLETAAKQSLLETRGESKRRDFLIHWMAQGLPKFTRIRYTQQIAGGNGHGLN
jgi:Lon protease-like protein